MCKRQCSNPCQRLQIPVVLPTVPTGFLTYFSEAKISKLLARQKFEPGPTAWEVFVLTRQPKPFIMTYNFAKYTRKKIEKRPH